jgi:hypothetical protein
LASHFNAARTPFFRASALRAALKGETPALLDLAHSKIRVELEKAQTHSHSHDAQEFKEVVGALLPWYTLWATRFVKKSNEYRLAY